MDLLLARRRFIEGGFVTRVLLKRREGQKKIYEIPIPCALRTLATAA